MRPLIAVTSGEPAGIGPELCLRLAEHDFGARLVVLADRELLRDRAQQIGLNQFVLQEFDIARTAADSAKSGLEVLHMPLAAASVAGELDAANAPYVLALLDRALEG